MESTKSQNKNQSSAIISLVFGIIAFLFSFIPCLGLFTIITGVLAVVFGSIAVSRNKHNENKGISIAGLTMGVVSLIITIVWILFVVGFNTTLKTGIEEMVDWVETQSGTYEISTTVNDLQIDEEDMKTLDDLEKVLDKLENASDEIDKEVSTDAIKEVNKEIKESLKEAKEEIHKIKTDSSVNVIVID